MRIKKPSSFVILGVDPGTLITGYGILSIDHGTVAVLACDVISSKRQTAMPLRLRDIYANLVDIIDRYHPDEFAIESAFYGKNAQSALKIGLARGVSILAAVNKQIPTTEYTPREIKKAITGNGSASKNQVEYMVRMLLKRSTIPKFLDVSDALAVALCHYQRLIGCFPIVSKHKQSRTSAEGWAAFARLNPNRVIGGL
jgi:crossover junction endodeoxyribonuclease RuvC